MERISVDPQPFQALWGFVVKGRPFDVPMIARQCKIDGGHDFSGLKESDIEDVFSSHGSGKVEHLAFFCSEVLAYYLACLPELSELQIISFTLNAVLAKKLDRLDLTDWEMKLQHVMPVLCYCKERVNYEALVCITDCIFTFDQ